MKILRENSGHGLTENFQKFTNAIFLIRTVRHVMSHMLQFRNGILQGNIKAAEFEQIPVIVPVSYNGNFLFADIQMFCEFHQTCFFGSTRFSDLQMIYSVS